MQAYADMKDSGVDWLGDIPTGWKLLNVSRIFNFAKGSEAQKLTNEYIGQYPGEYPVYSGQTSNGGIIGHYQGYEFDETGCILVTTVGAKAMTARFIQGKFSLSQNCLIMRPSASGFAIHPKYYSYLVEPLFIKERSLIPDHMQPSMRMSDLSSYKVVAPDINTQQKIADFLDTETAQIDNLIAKQERLLELLEEKRRATITHAVTRGLDPSVELKETNIPWLGQIPTHWKLIRFGAVLKESKRVTSEDGLDLLSVSEYYGVAPRREKFAESEGKSRAETTVGYRIVEEGNLVMNYMLAWKGAQGVSSYDGIVSPAYSVFEINHERIDAPYLHYLTRTDTFKGYFRAWSKGIIDSRLRLYPETFLKLCAIKPPVSEQHEIVEHIRLEERKSQRLKQKIQTQITLLRERRTSLISHAVTGKIKV